MEGKVLENRIIEHCAPTLAGIKSASLFNYFHAGEKVVQEELNEVNALLNEKGVYVEALLWREKSVLIYTYRPKQLQKELELPGVMRLLAKYGYQNCKADECICYLKKRLCDETCFPHEIGLFLGYPLEDVEGFIEYKGKNFKYCGLWKVYCNVDEKEKLFGKLKKCTEVYVKVFSEGRSLIQMTVCA